MALSFIPTQFLLIGLFFVAAFISTAIGTSMGTIATIAPVAVELTQAGISPSLGASNKKKILLNRKETISSLP